MSNTFTTAAVSSSTLRGLRLAAAAATLALAIVGSIASAQAAAAGGGNGRGGGDNGGGTGDPSAVIVYGTPGNCPPTVACGPTRPGRPQFRPTWRHDACGDYRPGSRLYRQCRKEL